MTLKEFQIQRALGTMTPDLIRRITTDPNSPANTLEYFANVKSRYSRRNVAKNANTPRRTLAKLCSDRSSCVRLGVVANPYIPTDMLQELSKDPMGIVNCAAQERLNRRKNYNYKDTDENIFKNS